MQLTAQEIANIRLVLKKISFLEHLKLTDLDEFISNLQKRPFRRGETIIQQGDPGETFYILASGRVGVFRKALFRSKRIATLEKDSYFGEMSLLSNEQRSATVVGEEEGELYYLPRDAFKKVLLSNGDIAAMIRQTAEYRQAQNRAIDLESS